jgi:hypothetical protein
MRRREQQHKLGKPVEWTQFLTALIGLITVIARLVETLSK